MAYFSSSLRCQPSCKGSFCLGSQPSLATCKGATVEVVKARCHYCSSKLYLSFGPFEAEALYSKGGCARITTLGQPPAGSKMVLSRVRVVKKKGEAAKLQVATIVDLTFHGQLHMVRFRRVANVLGLRATLILQLCKNDNFGIAAILVGPCALPLREALLFSIVDLTFHGQRHIFRVRCQPPCSDKCKPLKCSRKGDLATKGCERSSWVGPLVCSLLL